MRIDVVALIGFLVILLFVIAALLAMLDVIKRISPWPLIGAALFLATIVFVYLVYIQQGQSLTAEELNRYKRDWDVVSTEKPSDVIADDPVNGMIAEEQGSTDGIDSESVIPDGTESLESANGTEVSEDSFMHLEALSNHFEATELNKEIEIRNSSDMQISVSLLDDLGTVLISESELIAPGDSFMLDVFSAVQTEVTDSWIHINYYDENGTVIGEDDFGVEIIKSVTEG